MDRFVNKIDVRQLNTEIMSMDFFDILQKTSETPVLRQTGHIVGCPPDVRNGIAIEDELRRMLLDWFWQPEKKNRLMNRICFFADRVPKPDFRRRIRKLRFVQRR